MNVQDDSLVSDNQILSNLTLDRLKKRKIINEVV